MRPVTVTEFAKEREVSRARVYQWLDDGRISRLPEGGIDADDAHQKLGELLDRSKGARRDGNITSSAPAAGLDLQPQGGVERGEHPNGKEDSDYWAHKTRHAKFDAQLKEMTALERAGELISAEGVRKEGIEIARMVRNTILAMADELAPIVDPASPERAHKAIDDYVKKRVLGELTRRLDERAASTSREPAEALQ